MLIKKHFCTLSYGKPSSFREKTLFFCAKNQVYVQHFPYPNMNVFPASMKGVKIYWITGSWNFDNTLWISYLSNINANNGENSFSFLLMERRKHFQEKTEKADWKVFDKRVDSHNGVKTQKFVNHENWTLIKSEKFSNGKLFLCTNKEVKWWKMRKQNWWLI